MLAQSIASQPISFEDKIALALGGSNWQQLQQSTHQYHNVPPQTDQTLPIAPDTEDDGDQVDQGPVMTAKQIKKKERFDSRVAQHAGEVLEMIDVDTVHGIAESVLWDQDPELLCSYNWQASTNDTNTIFGR